VDTAQTLLGEWQGVRAVDHHCHPLRRWPFRLTDLELRSAFSEAIDPQVAERHVMNTAAYQDALRRIGQILGCDATESALLDRRNTSEPAQHARNLLAATTTAIMLVDTGFAARDAFALEEQERVTGIENREIIRPETLAEALVASSDDPRAWFIAVRAALRAAVKSGAVGVKTICAYRASLALEPVDTDALGVAFAALRRRVELGVRARLTGNALCHALLFEAAQECRALDAPLQVHCGFGDPDEDLANSSPLGIRPLLIDPTYRGLRVTLLHCYPFHREAAYLCSVFPDIYMDLSLAIPFAGLDGVRAMRETLGLCPTSKLLYATDASRYPEVFFVAATAHREALAGALGELVDHGIFAIDRAIAAGTEVLGDNARQVYRLPAAS